MLLVKRSPQIIPPQQSLRIANPPATLPSPMGTSNVFGGRFIAVPEWALAYINEHGQPRDLQILTCLVSMINLHDKSVTVSVVDLAKLANTSKETVKRSLKWLSDNFVISVTVGKKPNPNTYTVNYTQQVIGSPVTPYRVMDDPFIGSPVTSLGVGDGVMYDPIKTIELPACDGNSETPRVIMLLKKDSTRNIEKAAGESDKVGDMILGADPSDKPAHVEKQKRKPRPEVNDLVSHFVYHPRSVMVSSYTFQDMNILRRTIRLLLDSGLTRLSIRKMIDKFFSVDRMRSAESPVLMFASKSVQQSLMDSVGTEISETEVSPMISLMLNDFQRTQDLPWDAEVDNVIKRTVIMLCMEACYRYPEVVAEIIENSSGVVNSAVKDKLSALNSLVNWHLDIEDCNHKELLSTLSGTTLPKELLSATKSSLRPAADTIVTAVYNYRRVDNHGN